MQSHVQEVPRSQVHRAAVARRWGGGFGESHLMGAGFRFSEMKAFCGWMTMTVDNNVNALHAAELYIL